jgi:hypothetical protein
MDKNSQEIFSRLTAQLAIKRAMIDADPWHYVNSLSERLSKALICINEIEHALVPSTLSENQPMRPDELYIEALTRLDMAQRVIDKFRTKTKT